MSLFPIFLKLDGRSCLVVGAGAVAESKVAGLLEAGAAVHVVAPVATSAIQNRGMAGEIRWSQREFDPDDLEGVFLSIVATSSQHVNERVFQEARRRGVLCNVVDDPPHCDFYYPSVVRRGDLQFAISTAGHSPALAQRLRGELEEQFGPEYGEWLVRLGRMRRGLFRRPIDPDFRRALLHRLASRERFEIYIRRKRSRKLRSRKVVTSYDR